MNQPNMNRPSMYRPNMNPPNINNMEVPDPRTLATEAFVAYLRDCQWSQEWRHQFFVNGLKKFIRSYPTIDDRDALEYAVDQLIREEVEVKAELKRGKMVFHSEVLHRCMNHADGQGPAQMLGYGFEMFAKPKIMKLEADHMRLLLHEILGCDVEGGPEGVTAVRITNASHSIEWLIHSTATLQLMPAGTMAPVTPAAAVGEGGNVVAGAVVSINSAAVGPVGPTENPRKKRKVEVMSEEEA